MQKKLLLCTNLMFILFLIPSSKGLPISENTNMMNPVDYKLKPETYWKKVLSDEVYNICRKHGTEKPGSGQYDKFYEPGTYYCACCGGDFPLFSSKAKFDSGTGWPSFYEAYDSQSVELVEEKGFFRDTTEARCGRCGSHLGDRFNDGPKPTGWRYCINSRALVFVPEGQKPKRTTSED